MKDNDLITLAQREADRLTDENDHGAAIIMNALIERVRFYRDASKTPITVHVSGGMGLRGRGGDKELDAKLKEAAHEAYAHAVGRK